jgi:hypothetical protein
MLSVPSTLLSLIAVTVLSIACTPTQPVNASSWSVQIKTSGGFVGIGKGNISIASDGKFKYEPPHAPDKPARPCEARLSSEELRTVSEAINQSKPEGWNLPGLNAAAPDAFAYELELHQGNNKHVYQVKWYDNTRDQLPDDLKRLSEAIDRAMQVAAKKCIE